MSSICRSTFRFVQNIDKFLKNLMNYCYPLGAAEPFQGVVNARNGFEGDLLEVEMIFRSMSRFLGLGYFQYGYGA